MFCGREAGGRGFVLQIDTTIAVQFVIRPGAALCRTRTPALLSLSHSLTVHLHQEELDSFVQRAVQLITSTGQLCVCITAVPMIKCVFITAVAITKLFAWGQLRRSVSNHFLSDDNDGDCLVLQYLLRSWAWSLPLDQVLELVVLRLHSQRLAGVVAQARWKFAVPQIVENELEVLASRSIKILPSSPSLILCLPLNIASSMLPLRMHSVSRDVVKA